MKHQRFLKRFLITIKLLFHRASTVDKRKSKPKAEESIAQRVKLKNERIAEF